MTHLRYACGSCGKWTCADCGWKRLGAAVPYWPGHHCGRCPSRTGTMAPTMHTDRMWRSHNEGDLPRPYPYGQRPETSETRTSQTGPEYYRGFRVPETGPYGRVDLSSWKLGVDAVLREELKHGGD